MSKFFSVTFHHTSRPAALRAIEREKASGLYHRALLWDCGKMGCVTRFYSLVLPERAPGQRTVAYMNAIMSWPDNAPYVEDMSLDQTRPPARFSLQYIASNCGA